jgi:Acetyltransferase (GNAT) domain
VTTLTLKLIWAIINDGAQAYKGIIPADRWTEPYMSREKLQHEIDQGVAFWGYEETGTLVGVMGLQQVQDVTLIRHAYVRTSSQKRGAGAHNHGGFNLAFGHSPILFAKATSERLLSWNSSRRLPVGRGVRQASLSVIVEFHATRDPPSVLQQLDNRAWSFRV